MRCKEIKPLLMGLLDGELTDAEKRIVESHLSGCIECRSEMATFRRLEEVATDMKLIEPSQQAWKSYWASIYNRLERKVGWLLFSLGSILLLGFGGYKLFEELFLDAKVPLVIKIAIAAVALGFIILMVSIVRERLTLRKFDKYKEVQQ